MVIGAGKLYNAGWQGNSWASGQVCAVKATNGLIIGSDFLADLMHKKAADLSRCIGHCSKKAVYWVICLICIV